MSESIDYENLEKILYADMTNPEKKWFFSKFDTLTKLCELVVETLKTSNIKNEDYDYFVDINESINKAISFFDYIDPNYGYMFQNILQEKNQSGHNSVIFLRANDYGGIRNSNVFRGDVTIEYSNNLGDVFEIVHEITHKFTSSSGQTGTFKGMLGEIPSITMEFLLSDYLQKDNKFDEKEIKKYKLKRISSSVNDACVILTEKILFEIYSIHKRLTENMVKERIEQLDHDSIEYEIISENFQDYLSTIVDRGCTTSIYRQKYIYGIVFASKIHQEILEDKNNFNLLKQLIHILGNGYNISNKAYEFSDESIDDLKNALIMEVSDISKYKNAKI